jgi:hypothetical protein
MWVPFIFGMVIGLGVREVLSREPEDEPKAQNPFVKPSDNTTPTPTLQAPPGWPADVNYMDCETFMAGFSKDEIKTLMTGVLSKTDAQWADAKAKLIASGQTQLAQCLDGARSVAKKAGWVK